MGEPTRHFFIVVIDIEGFSDRPDPIKTSLRTAMYDVMRTAVADVHLPWARFHRQDTGDGMLLYIPTDLSSIDLAGGFIRALNDGLAERSAMYSVEHAMRFRVALHHGLATEDGQGRSGDAVNIACRLVDAQLLRDTLRQATRAHLALIVSDSFHQLVIRPGHRSIDRSTFVPVEVNVKNLTGYRAWVSVPGYPSPPGIRPAATEPTPPADEPAPAPPVPAAASGLAGFAFNVGTVHGDAFAGDKNVHWHG